MMDESERLVESYIDNDLQDADRQSLCAWLQSDRAHRDRFIRACFLHWELFAIGRRKSLQNGVNELPRPRSADWRSARIADRSPRSVPMDRKRFNVRAVSAVAATLFMVCGMAAWLLIRAWQPETVAQVTRSTADAAWENPSTALPAGTFLRERQLIKLTRGRILATLASGVQVVAQGPCTFRVDAGNLLFLESGRITISVPRQASGFVVESPLARFVDLGTEFTLDMRPESGCELHVFSGLVEMQPKDARRADQLRVPEGRAVRYDLSTGTAETLPYESEQKMSL